MVTAGKKLYFSRVILALGAMLISVPEHGDGDGACEPSPHGDTMCMDCLKVRMDDVLALGRFTKGTVTLPPFLHDRHLSTKCLLDMWTAIVFSGALL